MENFGHPSLKGCSDLSLPHGVTQAEFLRLNRSLPVGPEEKDGTQKSLEKSERGEPARDFIPSPTITLMPRYFMCPSICVYIR